jgi:hypothetical protein
MSHYKYRLARRQRAEIRRQLLDNARMERDSKLSVFVRMVWNKRDDFLSDERKYLINIPTCESGTSFSGPFYFPIGTMLECWENCPEFTLEDGSKIFRWGGGLSITFGEAINLDTGVIIKYTRNSDNLFPKWQTLAEVSTPYRRKAHQLISQGWQPIDDQELIDILPALRRYDEFNKKRIEEIPGNSQ